MSDSDSRPHMDVRHDKSSNRSKEASEKWSYIQDTTKTVAGQRMKVCTFWLPILLQRDDASVITRWAIEMGLIDHMKDGDLTLKHLSKIEILEMILRALDRGILRPDLTERIFMISDTFNLCYSDALSDAFKWLEEAGEPGICQRVLEFGHQQTCFATLHLIFTEYAQYIQKMVNNPERTMMSLMAQPEKSLVQRSEEMKKKGNEKFNNEQYDEAVKFYTKAIKLYPDNHKIYGNRALCYIRSKKYLKAVGDGKRAILINPIWAKGHYRYCEALFSLGNVRKAIEDNKLAQALCKDDSEGVRDLEQQRIRFVADIELQDKQSKAANKRSVSCNTAVVVEPQQKLRQSCKTDVIKNIAPQGTEVKDDKQSVRSKSKTKCYSPMLELQQSGFKNCGPFKIIGQQTTVIKVKKEKQPGKTDLTAQTKFNTIDLKSSKSEFSSNNRKAEPSAAVKKREPKNRVNEFEDENQKETVSKSLLCKELRSVVNDAHTALTDLRSRNAEQAFSQALTMMETHKSEDLGLSTLDELLLLYGRASALTEIGQPEELLEAQKLMEKIKSFEERTFQCLVFYALGKVYLKQNRFAIALEHFADSLQMVKNQITPGKLTWPLTKEIVQETQPDYFKEILENAIEECRFPPPPNAVCQFDKCHGSLKTEIYFTDPDFKGFVQFCCCQSCTVEYHITCWKTLKTTTFFDKNEKDLLQEPCFTPDCDGQICSIKIFGPTGLVKCKFEAEILKPQTPKKPKVNQMCTSQKKLKSKEERKLKRKQLKQSLRDKRTINDEILQQKEDPAASQKKDWLLYRDRVLLQISQNIELLRVEKGLQLSTLTSSLKPWLELDSTRGNQIAKRMLNWQKEQPLETLGQAVELLLERKNRVWARILIQLLSSCLDVNPKLSSWACRLNNAGLNAAQSFIERYSDHLEQLDLSLLINFGPLQDMIIGKLGTRPEFFSSIGLTVTEYLKQAMPHDMRLFIWTLEEHRDKYESCHTILDEYFDMMDGNCSVLKKSDENQNNSPMKTKSRGRKKKQRETKGVFVLSGMRSVTPRDEWDQDFFEDDSLSFLHPTDPFAVPSNLRDQVADFEEQFNSTRHRSPFKNILDNHPDATRESLYDYFAQILEEHGPLVAEDPLLVGELDNFPPEAQQKIQEAGGFEAFLLDSLRFIKMGRCIGLMKHAVPLQQAGHGASLDDLDDIDPDTNTYSTDMNESAFNSYLDIYSDMHPILPNPYIHQFGFSLDSGVGASLGSYAGNDFYLQWSNGVIPQQLSAFSIDDLDLTESDSRSSQMYLSGGGVATTTEYDVLKKHAAAQTCPEIMSSVAVNTELYERFESCQGDMNKKEKSNNKLLEQIEEMTNGCDRVNQKHEKDIACLEEELLKIATNINVTNKELSLFQHKLEQEVKRDQKEKKANQEVLRSLKQSIEELVEENESLARNIRENTAKYETKLSDFIEQGNQSAAEKMSLEDEINRCKALFTSAIKRSHSARLSVVESERDQGLYVLSRELADAKALLTKLDEAAHRMPNQELEMTRSSCRICVQDIEKKISIAEAQYQEQMDQVKNSGRVGELLVNTNNQAEAPVQPLSVPAKEFVPQAPAQTSNNALHPPPAAPPAAAAAAAPTQMHHKPPARTTEAPHGTVFDKAMDRLAAIFPDYTRSDLKRCVQEYRSSSGGSLNSMSLQDMVGGVTQLILDHQERLVSVGSNVAGRGSPSHRATPPLTNQAPVWQAVGSQRVTHSSALNVEDPCIICYDDMTPDDICVLECRHSFHKECIKSWLKEQSTCPNCRDHALLPEDFPVLTGRRRQIL